jgi:hypothetical protein
MSTLVEYLTKISQRSAIADYWSRPYWLSWIRTGRADPDVRVPKMPDWLWVPTALSETFPLPSATDEPMERFLAACHHAGMFDAAATWLWQIRSTPNLAEELRLAMAVLERTGYEPALIARLIANQLPCVTPGSTVIPPGGQALLAMSDEGISGLFQRLGRLKQPPKEVAELFLIVDPRRWHRIFSTVVGLENAGELGADYLLVALAKDPAVFTEISHAAVGRLKDPLQAFRLASALAEIDAVRFGKLAEEKGLAMLDKTAGSAEGELTEEQRTAGVWLITHRWPAPREALGQILRAPLKCDAWRRPTVAQWRIDLVEAAVAKAGRDARSIVEAAFAADLPEVHVQGLIAWGKVRTAEDAGWIRERFSALKASSDGGLVTKLVRLGMQQFPEVIEEQVWECLAHKSRPVRDMAATSLAKLGGSRLERAAGLWSAKRSDVRLAAVAWLQALGSPEAVAELKGRLEKESDDSARDAILLALEKLGAGGDGISPAEMQERIARCLAKTGASPATWLDVKKLPLPKFQDGKSVDVDTLRYLLFRQSRVKEMRADIEARPLLARIDRSTSGDLALAVLQAYFASDCDADDRWAMAFAALLGDGRLVPALSRQIRDWADAMRGKLAEYGVQALALMGSDAALLAVDAMTIRYRSKNKNIGKAASEAFAEAARVRGLTVEELGDLVVPWLGFQPGQPRIVDAGKARIEVRITSDFKLAFRDAATNKKVAKIPDSAPEELKAEFKEISAGLKEAVKSQLLRMETLMVRQFRWPAARWRELFLLHPLLFPFAQRLVWVAYDSKGALQVTFRALEDRTLTDVADDPVELEATATVGILHPLELEPEQRLAWVKHLADYDVEPPFAQLERPVVLVEPSDSGRLMGDRFAGTTLNGMTFKGRAERLGWTRGSVCDAGGISFYLKTFPSAGVDVFIGTEGMFVGMDMESEVTLGKVFFVRHGSVAIGCYTYDEPGDEADPRLVAFGAVPVIAYSEAMGDLGKISGKAEKTGGEDGE